MTAFHELFYDPLGGWDEGTSIGAIGGHDTHVHVAAEPDLIVQLGNLAKSLGLSVRENAYFGDAVDPVHTAGSWHDKTGQTKDGKTVGLAFDASGSPSAMESFTRRALAIMRGRPALTTGAGSGSKGGSGAGRAAEPNENVIGDVAGGAASAAGSFLIGGLVDALKDDGPRLLLQVALVVGGAMLTLYGATRLAGISPASVASKGASAASTAAGVAAAPATGGGSLAATAGATAGRTGAKTAANQTAKRAARART